MLNENQKWILFWVFIAAFSLITALTIWGVFFGLNNLSQPDKEKIFNALIIEIVGAVILLFRTGFGKSDKISSQRKLWLDFSEGIDVRKFVGQNTICSPRAEDGSPIGEDIVNTILKDKGLYVMPLLPSDTESVFVTIDIDNEAYEGSFPVKSYVVELEEQVI